MDRLFQYQRGVFFISAALLLGWVASGIPCAPWLQISLLAVLVGLVGLPHGALDPLVARQAGLWKNGRELALFLLAYVVLSALALVVWLALPGLSLLVFLLYSAFHFSGDWRAELPFGFRLAAGVYIVSASALFFPEITGHYFALLTSQESGEAVLGVMRILAVPALVGTGLAMFPRRIPWVCKGELAALLAAGFLVEPLLFFLLYFCAQHSPRHLIHAARGLPAKAVWGTAIFFTALTLIFASIAFPLLQTLPRMEAVIQIVFVGLAVLTVPHMILVEYAAREA